MTEAERKAILELSNKMEENIRLLTRTVQLLQERVDKQQKDIQNLHTAIIHLSKHVNM